MSNEKNSKQRFTQTVQYYDQYRPDYPKAILEILQRHCGLTRQSVIADMGSGTGKLSRLFLERGNHLFGVEPNQAMRQMAEQLLSVYPNFVSVDGSAEHSGLAEHHIDFVVAAQAFHWFDRALVKKEFTRVLKPNGWVVLLWNMRQSDASPFMQAYEQLLQTFGESYLKVKAENIHQPEIREWFAPSKVTFHQLPNSQIFDLQGLIGRTESMSYLPKQGEVHEQMIKTLTQLFDRYQEDGFIQMIYLTEIYLGQL